MALSIKIRGETHVDYFELLCEKCDEQTTNEYLGGETLGVPHFEATCKKCGGSAKLKFNAAHWKGLPYKLDKD